MTLPQGKDKEQAIRSMFDRIAPRYDLVNRVMTFGMDVGWRKRAVRLLALRRGAVVADVACGTGDFCREISGSGAHAIGFDLSFGMLSSARTDVPLVQADALRMPLRDATVDAVTCGFALRNVVDIGDLFGEFARILRTAGRLAILEVGQPNSKVLQFGHRLYFHRIVPMVGGLLSDRDAYRYLPESTAYLPPPKELQDMLRGAGFRDVATMSLGMGAAQLITATRS